MAELSQNAFNERVKLTATFLNNIGVALLAAGVFVPAIGLVSDRPPIAAGQFLAIGTGCGVFAAVLTFVGARRSEEYPLRNTR